MLSSLRKTNLFFVLFGVWISVISIILLSIAKYPLFALINHHRSLFADVLFTFLTELGSGYILIPVGLYLLFKKRYNVILDLAIILIVNSVLMSWLKHYFYAPRPLLCYGRQFVETAKWVTLYEKYSFPSGHTSLAFALASYLSILYKKRPIVIVCFLIACGIGYSRVYLGEHFIFDVCFGSIFGVATTCIYCGVKGIFLNYRKKKAGKRIPTLVEKLIA